MSILFAVFQNNEFPSETEFPPGLRGCNQQADQPGAVCLLRLPVYGESPVNGENSVKTKIVQLSVQK